MLSTPQELERVPDPARKPGPEERSLKIVSYKPDTTQALILKIIKGSIGSGQLP